MTRPAALAALHAAVVLFGFAGLFGKWVALPAVAIVLWRTVVAAAALAGVAAWRGERVRPTPGLAANGAILALHWVAFFHAIQVSTVAVGLLGFASFPAFTLLCEHASEKRRVTAREVATLALVTGGLVVIVPSFRWDDSVVRGLAWGLLSGFTFALLAVRGRALLARHAPAAIALWQNAFAALVLVPVVAATGAAVVPDARTIGLLLALGVGCTALAHTLFVASMRKVTAHVASVVAALEPVYGIALAWLLLDEVPSARTIAGAVLIVSAAVVATTAPEER